MIDCEGFTIGTVGVVSVFPFDEQQQKTILS